MAKHNPVSQRIANAATADKSLLYPNNRIYILIWRGEGVNITPEQEAHLLRCSPASTITRAQAALRAKMQRHK